MTDRAPASVRPSPAARALRAAPTVLLAAAFAALAIRLSVRDAWRPLAPLFYATPLALVCAAALAATALSAWYRRWRVSLTGLTALAVSAVWLVANEVRAGPVPQPAVRASPPVRGVLWNVQHGRRGWEVQAREARRHDPDLVVLIEGPEEPEEIALWRRVFPEHAVLDLPGATLVLVRGSARRVLHWPEAPEEPDDAPVAEVEVRDVRVRLVLADVPSHPLRRRGPWLSRIVRRVERAGDPHVLVLGDFNTPRDSAQFDAWRGPLRSAFEAAGEGYAATWPVPLPVLTLDQVWAGPGIDLRRCATSWTGASDHLPVVFEFDVGE